MTNPATRVVVCCYQGDAHQVIDLMPLYLHHGWPVTILSPEDSPVLLPGLDCRAGGKRCYIGWDGVERMRTHLRILLDNYTEDFFLIHDADSFILEPELPAKWYADPNVLWANRVDNGVPEQQRGFAPDMPHIAFHPPWFLSRTVIERLLAQDVKPNEYIPFIDYWMVEAAVRAGVEWRDMDGRMSVPTAEAHWLNWAVERVGEGSTVIHSCKTLANATRLIEARKAYLARLTMNPDTRVAICCYEGDAHQMHLPLYTHHQCPVVVLSPEDSRAELVHEGVECRFAGKRAYIGQDSLDRQIEHLKVLLTYPENHFLIHDSDSVNLDAKIPDYLYAEPHVVWSNQVFDNIPDHQSHFPEGWPRVAFQPPYFLSRQTIEKMIAVADDPRCKASPMMPFIDFFMVQLTMVAGLEWRRFPDCMSFGICADPRNPRVSPAAQAMYTRNTAMALNAVRNEGTQIIHSVKDPEVAEALYAARRQYLGEHDAKPREFLHPKQVVGGDTRSNNLVYRRQMARNPMQTGLKA